MFRSLFEGGGWGVFCEGGRDVNGLYIEETFRFFERTDFFEDFLFARIDFFAKSASFFGRKGADFSVFGAEGLLTS